MMDTESLGMDVDTDVDCLHAAPQMKLGAGDVSAKPGQAALPPAKMALETEAEGPKVAALQTKKKPGVSQNWDWCVCVPLRNQAELMAPPEFIELDPEEAEAESQADEVEMQVDQDTTVSLEEAYKSFCLSQDFDTSLWTAGCERGVVTNQLNVAVYPVQRYRPFMEEPKRQLQQLRAKVEEEEKQKKKTRSVSSRATQTDTAALRCSTVSQTDAEWPWSRAARRPRGGPTLAMKRPAEEVTVQLEEAYRSFCLTHNFDCSLWTAERERSELVNKLNVAVYPIKRYKPYMEEAKRKLEQLRAQVDEEARRRLLLRSQASQTDRQEAHRAGVIYKLLGDLEEARCRQAHTSRNLGVAFKCAAEAKRSLTEVTDKLDDAYRRARLAQDLDSSLWTDERENQLLGRLWAAEGTARRLRQQLREANQKIEHLGADEARRLAGATGLCSQASQTEETEVHWQKAEVLSRTVRSEAEEEETVDGELEEEDEEEDTLLASMLEDLDRQLRLKLKSKRKKKNLLSTLFSRLAASSEEEEEEEQEVLTSVSI